MQYNSKIPDLSSDKWKYPSHKASLVHSVPCCKTLALNGSNIKGFLVEKAEKINLNFSQEKFLS